MKALVAILITCFASFWPMAPLKYIAAGQTEQECSGNPKAMFKTAREAGYGPAMMTIAYNRDGSERFNIFREAQKSYAPLRGWNWQKDPYNAKMQLTYLIMKDHSNFERLRPWFKDETETWKAALVCYNAGFGRLMERRAVARLKGIPADRWTGGLDRAYSREEENTLYGRPLYIAVNEYPVNIFNRAQKYINDFRGGGR